MHEHMRMLAVRPRGRAQRQASFAD
jgi:hypothetical protein